MYDGKFMQRYNPEVMVGLSAKLMLHLNSSFSNMNKSSMYWEGASFYAKYRFLSIDGPHRHFRMAAFGDLSYSTNKLKFDELMLKGENSGFETGLIVTGLLNKSALSATVSGMKSFDPYPKFDGPHMQSGLNYSLSFGYLLLPRVYENFEQLNLNLYVEMLGQQGFERRRHFTDLAPGIQFIFNSNTKLNLGYRFQVWGNAVRSLERSYMISIEHSLFNVL